MKKKKKRKLDLRKIIKTPKSKVKLEDLAPELVDKAVVKQLNALTKVTMSYLDASREERAASLTQRIFCGYQPMQSARKK